MAVQVAQIDAPVIAMIAAGASWASAAASLRTARRADQAARWAVEALSRTTAPRLSVRLRAGEPDGTGVPVPLAVLVQNHGENSGTAPPPPSSGRMVGVQQQRNPPADRSARSPPATSTCCCRCR